MLAIFIISSIISFPAQNEAKVHWGQKAQNWSFPHFSSSSLSLPSAAAKDRPENHRIMSPNILITNNQISERQPNIITLKSLLVSKQSQSTKFGGPWNDYNEYLTKLGEYYSDYYSEYGTRYNEYLAKFSEWLKSSYGGNSAPSSPIIGSSGSTNSFGWPMPRNLGESSDGSEWILPSFLGPNSLKPFNNRRRRMCPSRMFPPAPAAQNNNHKSTDGNNFEPKFAHPLVLPILHGNFTARLNRATETNFSTVDPLQQHLAMHSSVTLVVDYDAAGNKHIIVVDTGLSILKHAILTGMLSNGIQLPQVDTVCITHADTDTMGNLNLFPCAEIHSGNVVSRENLFARQSAPLFESNRSDLPFRHLYAHTELYLTPGMSFQDQSLIVRNVSEHGTVAIVGKLILNENDLTENLAIREFAVEDIEHRKLWQATRREIVCMADYIIPGYGSPFKVSLEIKNLAECGHGKSTISPPIAAWRNNMKTYK